MVAWSTHKTIVFLFITCCAIKKSRKYYSARFRELMLKDDLQVNYHPASLPAIFHQR